MTFNQTQMTGVYAIAFAISLAFCKKPAYLHYDNSIMKSHLLKSLHKISKQARNNKDIFIKAHTAPLYCSCRMPEIDLMFKCTTCQCWFHPDCQEIKLNARQMKHSRTVKNIWNVDQNKKVNLCYTCIYFIS